MSRENKPLNVKTRRGHWCINAERIGLSSKHGNYPTKAAAQKDAAILLADFIKGDYVAKAAKEQSKITIADAYEDWLKDIKDQYELKNISLDTRNSRVCAVAWIVKQKFSGRVFSQYVAKDIIHPFNIKEFRNEFERLIKTKWSAKSTRSKKKIYIQNFLAHILDKGWVAVNPLDSQKVTKNLSAGAKVSNRLHLQIDQVEYDKLWEDGISKESLVHRTVFYVQACTGIRQSEARALHWRNVNLKDGYIFVTNSVDKNYNLNPTKTEKGERPIALDDTAIALLSELKLESPNCSENDICFPGHRHPFLSQEFFRDLFKRAVRRSGAKRVTSGCLRHYFATRTISELGESWADVADAMGHKNAAFTRSQYAFLNIDLKKIARQRKASRMPEKKLAVV
jgi:integrase